MRNLETRHEHDLEILAIDVGAGTQDILLFKGAYERSYKLVLPAPTVILANIVEKATKKRKNIIVTGETMGGGPLNRALYEHIEAGLRVCMTKFAAFTVRDNLDFVKEQGIDVICEEDAQDIIGRKNFGSKWLHIETRDVSKDVLTNSLEPFNISLNPSAVGMAVEDHGVARRGQKDRECRFEHFMRMIPGNVVDFAFEEPPEHYSRMAAVKRILRKEFPKAEHLVMDTKIAAMFGAYYSSMPKLPTMCIDAGNSHTTVGLIFKDKLVGLFEHHTATLTPRKTETLLRRFIAGKLKGEDVLADGGHGCYMAEQVIPKLITATGPRRGFLKNMKMKVEFVNPQGDVMLAGCVGLIEAVKRKYGPVGNLC